jgi:hypothetical protein
MQRRTKFSREVLKHPSWLVPVLLAALGACKDDIPSSPYSAADVVWVSTGYPTTMDASVPVTGVKVQGSGDATCSRTDRSSGTQWRGAIPAIDSTIPDLLSRPGLVSDLATPCPLVVYDGGPYIVTRFAPDDDQVVHSRLVMDSCSTANLEALMQALERIGDACIATATVYFDQLDGGGVG